MSFRDWYELLCNCPMIDTMLVTSPDTFWAFVLSLLLKYANGLLEIRPIPYPKHTIKLFAKSYMDDGNLPDFSQRSRVNLPNINLGTERVRKFICMLLNTSSRTFLRIVYSVKCQLIVTVEQILSYEKMQI